MFESGTGNVCKRLRIFNEFGPTFSEKKISMKYFFKADILITACTLYNNILKYIYYLNKDLLLNYDMHSLFKLCFTL